MQCYNLLRKKDTHANTVLMWHMLHLSHTLPAYMQQKYAHTQCELSSLNHSVKASDENFYKLKNCQAAAFQLVKSALWSRDQCLLEMCDYHCVHSLQH